MMVYLNRYLDDFETFQYKDLSKNFFEAFRVVYPRINTAKKLDKYYFLYLELRLFSSSTKREKVETEIADIVNYRERISNNSYLYAFDRLETSSSGKFDEAKYLQSLEEFIDKFGIDSLFDSYQGYFINLRLDAYLLHHYMYIQFKSQYIDQLEKNLSHLEEKGLSKKKLLKYFVNNPQFMRLDKNDLAAAFDSTNVVANKEILAIVFLRILDAFHSPYEHLRDEAASFKTSDHKFSDLIDSIVTMKDRKKIVRKILKELNLLEILGKPRNRKGKRK